MTVVVVVGGERSPVVVWPVAMIEVCPLCKGLCWIETVIEFCLSSTKHFTSIVFQPIQSYHAQQCYDLKPDHTQLSREASLHASCRV